MMGKKQKKSINLVGSSSTSAKTKYKKRVSKASCVALAVPFDL